MLNRKKNVYSFLIKKPTFICWTRIETEKPLEIAKQLIKKNSICCLKNQAINFTE